MNYELRKSLQTQQRYVNNKQVQDKTLIYDSETLFFLNQFHKAPPSQWLIHLWEMLRLELAIIDTRLLDVINIEQYKKKKKKHDKSMFWVHFEWM